MFEVSYSQVQAALVQTYAVPARDLGRFSARITFLQKGGLLGVSPGKGRALSYTPDLMHRLIFAMELNEFGTTPQAVLETVGDLWNRRIRSIFENAEKAAMNPAGPGDIVLLLGGNSLMVGGWTSTAKALPNVNACPLHKLAQNMNLLLRYDDPPPRAMVVNLTGRLRVFHASLVKAHDLREPVAGAPKRGKTK
jgi:hypothetical protein